MPITTYDLMRLEARHALSYDGKAFLHQDDSAAHKLRWAVMRAMPRDTLRVSPDEMLDTLHSPEMQALMLCMVSIYGSDPATLQVLAEVAIMLSHIDL